MTERERLIEKLSIMEEMVVDPKADFKIGDVESVLRQARKMLEKAIVPPCKVGDIAYFIIKDEVSGERYIASQRINDVSTKGFFISTSTLEENCNDFEPYSEIGKTVYLSEAEAKQALKGDVE